MSDTSFIDRLVEKGVFSSDEAARVKNEAASGGASVESQLAAKKIPDEDVLAAKSETYGVPARVLGGKKITFEVLKYIPEESARHYSFVPLGVKDGVLEVGMIDPA